METLSISGAARKLGRQRPAIYRLIESGILRRLPGARIPVADLEKIPKQKADLREVALARIRRAGHDPRRILFILREAARETEDFRRADADTLLHAGRFLLEGNLAFLRTLEAENPPTVEHRAPDGIGAAFVGLPFPAFIAGRIRLFAEKAPARIPTATAALLWKGFWLETLKASFSIFPLFRSGWMRLAPAWQDDATIFCHEQETVLSFASPVYRPTQSEKNAAQYMEEHFPEDKIGKLYGRDNITPARLLIILAVIAARDGNSRLALDHLAALGVPSQTAAALARLVSRILGRFRFSLDSESKIEKKDLDLHGLHRRTLEEEESDDDPGSNESLAPSPYDILDEKEQEELKAKADRNPDKVGLSYRDRALQGAAGTGAAAYCVSMKPTRRAMIQALGITMKTLRRWAAPSRKSRPAAD